MLHSTRTTTTSSQHTKDRTIVAPPQSPPPPTCTSALSPHPPRRCQHTYDRCLIVLLPMHVCVIHYRHTTSPHARADQRGSCGVCGWGACCVAACSTIYGVRPPPTPFPHGPPPHVAPHWHEWLRTLHTLRIIVFLARGPRVCLGIRLWRAHTTPRCASASGCGAHTPLLRMLWSSVTPLACRREWWITKIVDVRIQGVVFSDRLRTYSPWDIFLFGPPEHEPLPQPLKHTYP